MRTFKVTSISADGNQADIAYCRTPEEIAAFAGDRKISIQEEERTVLYTSPRNRSRMAAAIARMERLSKQPALA